MKLRNNSALISNGIFFRKPSENDDKYWNFGNKWWLAEALISPTAPYLDQQGLYSLRSEAVSNATSHQHCEANQQFLHYFLIFFLLFLFVFFLLFSRNPDIAKIGLTPPLHFHWDHPTHRPPRVHFAPEEPEPRVRKMLLWRSYRVRKMPLWRSYRSDFMF